MIQDFTLDLNLKRLKTTLLEFVNDEGRQKSNQGGYQSNLLGPEDMPSQLKNQIDLKIGGKLIDLFPASLSSSSINLFEVGR